MFYAFILAALLHIGVLLFIYYGGIFHKPLMIEPPRPIPMVWDKVGKKTTSPRPNLPKPTADTVGKKDVKPKQPQPAEKKPEPAKEAPKKETTPAPLKPPSQKEKPKEPEPKSKEKSTVEKKKEPTPKKETKTPPLKDLTKAKTTQKPNKEKKEDSFDKLLGDILENNNTDLAPEIAPELTISELDLIRQHLKPCWNVPAGMQNAQNLAVEVEVYLTIEGAVTKADIIDKSRMRSDPAFQVAAESALRAVQDPVCSPWPLPRDKYRSWQHLIITFNPKDMA